MALNWNYEEPKVIYEILAEGDYRVRIEKAEEQVSKRTGNQMIYMELKVSGKNQKLFHYVVFDPENRERTNKNLQSLFESFGIEANNFNLQSWVGKVGACKTKIQRDDNYGDKAVVRYFLNKKQSAGLPVWQEGVVKSEPALNLASSDIPW